MKEQSTIGRIIKTALWMALVFLVTLSVRIPSPIGGYIHIADALVLLGAWLLGPIEGLIAAGLGSAFADFYSGAALFAPGSLVIKALMAVIAWFVFKILPGKRMHPAVRRLIAAIIAELWMVAGYYVYEIIVLGPSAVLAVPGNFVQAGVSVVFVMILTAALSIIGPFRKALSGDKESIK